MQCPVVWKKSQIGRANVLGEYQEKIVLCANPFFGNISRKKRPRNQVTDISSTAFLCDFQAEEDISSTTDATLKSKYPFKDWNQTDKISPFANSQFRRGKIPGSMKSICTERTRAFLWSFKGLKT